MGFRLAGKSSSVVEAANGSLISTLPFSLLITELDSYLLVAQIKATFPRLICSCDNVTDVWLRRI
jgi:hypothetical protein